MSEASWLTGPSVNGDSYVNNILDIAEQVIKIFVRHVEGHVANEKGLAWIIGSTVRESSRGVVDLFSGAVRLNGEATTLEWLLIQGLHSLCSVLRVGEFNVAKSVHVSNLR